MLRLIFGSNNVYKIARELQNRLILGNVSNSLYIYDPCGRDNFKPASLADSAMKSAIVFHQGLNGFSLKLYLMALSNCERTAFAIGQKKAKQVSPIVAWGTRTLRHKS